MRASPFLLLPALAFLACSAQVQSPPPGTCGTPAACPANSTDVTGTWDVVGMTSGGSPETGTISIASNVFVLSVSGAVLSYTAVNGAMTVSYQRAPGDTVPIAAQRIAAASSFGIMPLDVGGTWTFSDPAAPAHACTVNVGASQIDGTCTGSVSGWPDFLGSIAPNITYIAHKTASGTSQFGDLSGTWALDESDDTMPTCTVTFSASTISADCSGRGVGGSAGTATLAFNGNGNASGSTSGGIEYSGHRR
jgi:hypothetical protein